MGSFDDVLRLLRRANKFKEDAKSAFSQGFYDFACFYSEQAVQLLLKAYILKNLGIVPRTHDIRTLLDYVYKFEQKDEVRDLITRFRKTLASLERSYTDARYGFIDYDMNDGRECLNIMEIIFNVIKVE